MSEVDKIKESLLKELEAKGANIEHFSSLIDDYIWYWVQEKAMQEDVKNRGFTYTAVSAAGKRYEKDNPSVKNALMYNKQKLAILKELGLTTSNVASDEDEL